jgi:GT2 family glycosyltransferase
MPALVSVVVPTYRRPAMLRGALSSVTVQSVQDLEVIVTDDASGDGTEAVVRSFDDKRLIYQRHASNIGQLANIRSGISRASGRYLALLHDDDLWDPGLIEALLRPLERRPHLVAAFSDHWVMDAQGRVDERASHEFSNTWGRSDLPPGEHSDVPRIALLRQSMPLGISGLIRREAVDWSDFPDEVGDLVDVWLAYLVARTGRPIWFEKQRLASYRLHPASSTNANRLNNSRAATFLRRRLADDPLLAEHRTIFLRQYGIACVTHGISLLRDGRPREARRVIVDGVRYAPSARACAAAGLSVLPARLASRLSSRPRTG